MYFFHYKRRKTDRICIVEQNFFLVASHFQNCIHGPRDLRFIYIFVYSPFASEIILAISLAVLHSLFCKVCVLLNPFKTIG